MDQAASQVQPICDYPLLRSTRITLDITRSSVAALSTLFLVVSLIVLSCRKLLGYYNFRLVLYQLLSSLLYSLVTVSQIVAVWYEREGTVVADLCKAVGLGLTYSNWTVLLFKFYILTELLYYALVRDKKKVLVRTKRMELLVVVSLFLLPAFFSWVPYINDTFGYSGAWCWIRKKLDNCSDNPVGFKEEMGLWYGPLFLLMIALLVMISVTVGLLVYNYCKTRHCPEHMPIIAGKRTNSHNLRMLPLLGYPAIYILTHLIALTDRVVRFAVGTSPYGLVMAHAVTNPAGGLFASIFFWIHLVLISVLRREPTSPPNPLPRNDSPTSSHSDEGKESEHDKSEHDGQFSSSSSSS